MSKKSQIASVAAAIGAFNTGMSMYQDYREKWYARRTFFATVPEDTFVYRPLLKWVNDSVNGRAVRFHSTSNKLEKLYDSEGRTRVVIEGHELFVALKKPSLDLSDTFELATDNNPFSKSLIFSTTDPKGIDALERFLDEMREKENRRIRDIWLYKPGTYGWTSNNFPFRDIDSIFLANDDKAEIMTDIEEFMNNEERYHRMGIPWHRGYLLYGPPGNGKSSLAAGLAHRYKFNMYNMPLSTVKDDKSLTDLVSGVEPHSFLLIEDIDIFSKSVTRDEQADKGPTLAGLLNSLDGVGTPNGLITFMTTNVPDVLDSALVRPGRVDFRLELKTPTDIQISDMFHRVYGEPLGGRPVGFESMAALANVFKRFPDDVKLAREEVLTRRSEPDTVLF